MKDFFVSYNRADRTWAEWIAWQLEAARYTVVIQAWDFRPGGNFVLDMQSATGAERTIAALSPDYLASEFTAPEWAAAFAQDPTGKQGKLLPVRVRECEPKGLLPQIVYIDLLKKDEATAKHELLEGVIRGRAKPKVKPDFPGTRVIANAPRFPDSLPAVWNIPHLRNPNFTGREEELEQLRESHIAGKTAALAQTQAIHGLGGVGKTQLAIEYAYRHETGYDIVWWIRSEESVTLVNDYASLATKLTLPEQDATEQRIVVEAVKEWLRRNRGWLLIFDNAEDVKLLSEYIPSSGKGHIIITSRNPNWSGVAKSLSVKKLHVEEAIEFLLKRTGSQDKEAAKALAEKLDCLPLALEQASAFIEASHRPMTHYLELFENHQSELMEHGELSTKYPATVATTWSISFGKVEQENATAAELLKLCAFFAPDDIPLNMITEGAEELPESLRETAKDSFLFDKALMALQKYSLIEVEDEKISIHRLVQAVIHHSMDEETIKHWTGITARVVNSSFPLNSDDVRMWPLCLSLMPHASIVLSHTEATQFTSNETARLLNQIGLYLNARAEYAQAKIMYERAIVIGEATLGPDHPDVATWLNNLGNVLRAQGDLESAKALYERAIVIGEAMLGPDHSDVAIRLNNLGNVLKAQGDLEGAKALYERAIVIGEATLGPYHPTVAIRLNNLGNVLREQGDLEGAKALLERTLVIGEAMLGPDPPTVAIRLNNLGNVLREQGDLESAKALYECALIISEVALGPNHSTVAVWLNNLGNVLRMQGDLEGAKALYERALAIGEATLGPAHPDVAIWLSNLSSVLKAQSDLEGAKALYKRSLLIFKKFLGDNPPSTRIAQDNLHLLERKIENSEE